MAEFDSFEKLNSTSGGTEIGGVKFAPLSIPMKRRWQTVGVLHWVFLLFVTPILGPYIFYYVLVYTQFWYLMVLYAAWVYYDWNAPKEGGRAWQALRGARFYKLFIDYFPISLVKTAEISPENNYVFGVFPHGILSYGVLGNFALAPFSFDHQFPGLKAHPLTLALNFWVPFRREYVMALGLCDVSRDSIRYLLGMKDKGHCVIIVVGGAEEALDAHPGNFNLTLRKRKGFVREAIIGGAHLVPVYTFGENNLYVQLANERGSWLRNMQEKMKKYLGFSSPVLHGRGIFNYSYGFMPYRTPITTVVGTPIPVVQHDNPPREYVDEVHEIFKTALYDLFEGHKADHGIADDAHLQFF